MDGSAGGCEGEDAENRTVGPDDHPRFAVHLGQQDVAAAVASAKLHQRIGDGCPTEHGAAGRVTRVVQETHATGEDALDAVAVGDFECRTQPENG